MPQSVLFVGGGSIGHISPSIAVARELLKMHPEIQARFVCSQRPEDALFIERQGFVPIPLDAPRLSWNFPMRFFRAYQSAYSILVESNPKAIFSKGGYVSVPVCLAAWRLKIPIILHESDTVSGWANTFVGLWAKVQCHGFPTKKAGKHLFTGNPVDTRFTEGVKERGFTITGFPTDRPVLLVIGGSQGSQAINAMIAQELTSLLELCSIAHITGNGKQTVTTSYPGYWQIPFAYEEMSHLYAIASLALIRASAATTSELAANSIPAIMIPLRKVAHDHQEHNARILEKSGGCIVLEQNDRTQNITDLVRHLLSPEIHATMQKAIHKLYQPDAARHIAEIILQSLA
ncbi:MAG: UDP-N-acetylglucosamine--N-acetylmuramyl-(pentapeptide) pyrophosphoryl-undecaprenol N-acetylglucosamine transferase [Candidatus Peregrinibacteria bacterium]